MIDPILKQRLFYGILSGYDFKHSYTNYYNHLSKEEYVKSVVDDSFLRDSQGFELKVLRAALMLEKKVPEILEELREIVREMIG